MVTFWIRTNSVVPSFSTETLALKRMAVTAQNLYGHSPSCSSSFIFSRVAMQRSQKTSQEYNAHVHPLTEISIESTIVIQYPRIKL